MNYSDYFIYAAIAIVVLFGGAAVVSEVRDTTALRKNCVAQCLAKGGSYAFNKVDIGCMCYRGKPVSVEALLNDTDKN